MKRILPILLLLSIFAAQTTFGQGWEWARAASMPSGTEGFYCATDASGYVYGSGEHWSTIHFDSYTLTGAGVYVVKYDSAGNVKWAISTNAISSTSGSLGLTTDLFGNVYLLGEHDTTITFGGHILTVPGPHNWYYFIAKIDTSGTVKWIKNIGDAASQTLVQGSDCITTDIMGNIYITGPFSNNPIIGSYTLINANSDNTNDILVAKLDSSGGVLWAKGYGGKKGEFPTGISVTPSHKVYITGYFNSDTLAFGATNLYDTTTSGWPYCAIFLAKLDSLGNPIWSKWDGGSGYDYATGMTTNSFEDAIVTGCYSRNPISIDTFSLPAPNNSSYGYLAKYDSSGTVIWVKIMQGQYIIPWLPVLDPCGNIWIISDMGSVHLTTNDTIDGHILSPLAINGDPNFIACWNNAGTFIAASALASGSTDDPNGIATDRCGNVYVIADKENCDTLIIANDTFITVGGESMFMAKYNPNLGCGHCYINSVHDPVAILDFALYPNPAAKSLTISATDKIASVAISNLLGQTMYNHKYNSEQVQVDVADLPAGIYLIRINGTEVRKFVKQ